MTYDAIDDSTGFANLVDEDGNVRRLLGGQWLTPGKAIRLRDDHLEVDWRQAVKTYVPVSATAEILAGFVQLSSVARSPATAVCRYARKAGLLDLCQHLLPFGHDPWPLPISMAATNATCVPRINCKSLAGREPISAWLYWSRQAAALRRVVERLRHAVPARQGDWLVLAEEAPWVAFEDADPVVRQYASDWIAAIPGFSVETQRNIAADAVTTWLHLSGTGIAMRWSKGTPEVHVEEGTLFGAIGLGLLLDATGATRLALCPGCGSRPAPRPARGRSPVYCERCLAKNLPQERAQERYRSTPEFKERNRLRAQANRAKKP
jgi:hypothetical protein